MAERWIQISVIGQQKMAANQSSNHLRETTWLASEHPKNLIVDVSVALLRKLAQLRLAGRKIRLLNTSKTRQERL